MPTIESAYSNEVSATPTAAATSPYSLFTLANVSSATHLFGYNADTAAWDDLGATSVPTSGSIAFKIDRTQNLLVYVRHSAGAWAEALGADLVPAGTVLRTYSTAWAQQSVALDYTTGEVIYSDAYVRRVGYDGTGASVVIEYAGSDLAGHGGDTFFKRLNSGTSAGGVDQYDFAQVRGGTESLLYDTGGATDDGGQKSAGFDPDEGPSGTYFAKYHTGLLRADVDPSTGSASLLSGVWGTTATGIAVDPVAKAVFTYQGSNSQVYVSDYSGTAEALHSALPGAAVPRAICYAAAGTGYGA